MCTTISVSYEVKGFSSIGLGKTIMSVVTFVFHYTVNESYLFWILLSCMDNLLI